MNDSYAGALDHYLSPARHDAVKTRWEEPASRALFDTAVSHLDPADPLRVVDVGCGTGDGLMLLRSAPAASRRMLGPRGMRYTGLDLNEDLLRAARDLHAENGNIRFLRADVREGLPVEPAELYLSCGVPYSHLSVDELRAALGVLFAAARRNPRPVALIVDVLGRYSIEWTAHWQRQRWPYRMSFFQTERAAGSTEMTTYGDCAN